MSKMVFAEAPDDAVASVGFASCWKRDKTVADNSTQSDPVSRTEGSAQTEAGVDASTEPDPPQMEMPPPGARIDDKPGMREFMERVAASVIAALDENLATHAFDGYDVVWEDDAGTTSLMSELQPPSRQSAPKTSSRGDRKGHGKSMALSVSPSSTPDEDALTEESDPVTALDWNSTGALLAAGHGAMTHEGWCMHRTSVTVWAVFRRPNADRKASEQSPAQSTAAAPSPATAAPAPMAVSIDISSCVTAVAFHRSHPSLLAIGSYTGQLTVVDVDRAGIASGASSVIASTDLNSDEAHRDAINAIGWIGRQQLASSGQLSFLTSPQELATAGSDGKVIVWSLGHNGGPSSPVSLKALRSVAIGSGIGGPTTGSAVPGVNSFSWLATGESSMQFVAGTEGGKLLKCSAGADAAVSFAYESHSGPIQSVAATTFHRNVFATASSDGTVRIYNALQGRSVLSLAPSDETPLSLEWSPSRPCVFGVGCADGRVYFYDLSAPHGQVRPVASLRAGGSSDSGVTSLVFNRTRARHAATGHEDGTVRVWELAGQISQRSSGDSAALDRFGDIKQAKKAARTAAAANASVPAKSPSPAVK